MIVDPVFKSLLNKYCHNVPFNYQYRASFIEWVKFQVKIKAYQWKQRSMNYFYNIKEGEKGKQPR